MYASFKAHQVIQMLWTSIFGNTKVVCALVNEKREDLAFISTLVEAGTLRSAVDKTFPLADAAGAHRYAESGLNSGAVVITVP